ncbi:DUF2187 family protein [Bacillus tuaregi]|uniref:DUF2187 family protein n=1 Tax=Bacillus tuaregi TaxID=1816695 RepID=UPI0008F7EBE3|nr:DUF2187 family protein [Bacillus tuaregi]
MADEKEVKKDNKEEVSVNKAAEGDLIEIKKGPLKGKKGKVIVLRENSVIVEIGTNSKTDEPIKTVVNHKNYKKAK